jgi:preprotein translocase subunit SecG
MEQLVTIIHVLAAAGVIGLVLLQHGKGADMGAAFGSGASGSLFGVSGSSNFMSKATAACVVVFFSTSLTLAYMASHHAGIGSVVKAPAKTLEVKTDAAKPLETTPADTEGVTVESAGAAPNENPDAGSTAKDIPN